MLNLEELDSLFLQYGYTLQEKREACRVYLLRQGMYYGAEIVIFDESEQQELANEYSGAGFSVKRQHFQSIEEAEEYLFSGFFKTEVSRLEIKSRYRDFVEKQVRPYGKDSGISYKYIQMPFSVYKDNYDDGKQGINLLETIFSQIESPGAHLVIVEAAAGYGKTCTSYELYHSFLEHKTQRAIKPIFTELSRNRDAKQFKYVLWSEIDKEKATTAKQDLVVYNIRKGRIPLIIDGFDELLSKDIDSGSDEGLDEFQQVETMLSTIGNLLREEAKIILTSRKTAIFAGAAFEQWIEGYDGAFDVMRIQLERPRIESWLTSERLNQLTNAGVPFRHIANPVLLTYLRNISDDDFTKVVESPGDITVKYFQFLLSREKERQDLIVSVNDQLAIFEQLALNFLEYDMMGDTRQFVKELIVDYNKQMLMHYKELSPKPIQLSELADTLTNHALLDRVGNKDYVAFVNEYVFGYLLGRALLRLGTDCLSSQGPLSEDILERAVLSFKYAVDTDRQALWGKLYPLKPRMTAPHILTMETTLIHRIKDNYNDCSFNSLYFEDVIFNELDGTFSNATFVDCTFKNCTFSVAAFVRTFFTGCKFKGCVLAADTAQVCSAHFFGCDDYHSGFIAGFKITLVTVAATDQVPLEIQILSKYFKVDGKRPKMKYVSQLRGEFREDCVDEMSTVFESLRKQKYIQVSGNNSFITQAGINYYHKHAQ
jgi:hypothetical protein